MDSMTYAALKNGECRQGCQPQVLPCENFPRFETKANVPIVSSSCPDGVVASDFSCGCTILSRQEMLRYTQSIDGHRGGCHAVCSEKDRDLSKCVVQPTRNQKRSVPRNCEEMICLYKNCASQITRIAVDIVKKSTCSFSLATRMWTCEGVLEIDDPGYHWAKHGSCIDACSIEFRPDSCLFQARYGHHPDPSTYDEIDETSDKKNKKPKRPGNKKRSKTQRKKITKKSKDDDKTTDKKKQPKDTKRKAKIRGKKKKTTMKKSKDDADKEPLDGGQYFLYDGYIDEYYTMMDESDSLEVEEEEPPAPPPEPTSVIEIESDPFVENTHSVNSGANAEVAIIEPPQLPPVVDDPVTTDGTPTNASTEVVRVSTKRVVFSKDDRVRPMPSGSFESYGTPWMPCRQDCMDPQFKENDRERFVLCRSMVTGMPVPRAACPSIDKTSSIEPCPKDAVGRSCRGSFVYEYGDWSECKSDEKGSRNRVVDCYERLEDGSLFPTTEASCSVENKQLSCDPRQCHQVIYLASEWSDCDCDRLVKTRSLTCSSIVEADKPIDNSICKSIGIPRPPTIRNCSCDTVDNGRRLLQTSDPCANKTCSGHGICRSGVCECTPPYKGDDCASMANVTIRDDPTCRGNFTIDGVCCSSGVYDRKYTCCKKEAMIDKEGNCCNGQIDACGICNGDGLFVDVYGGCCNTTLDANGFCCHSGNVDECGVCDGYGTSCDFRLEFSVIPNGTAEEISDGCVENLISRTLTLSEGGQEHRVTHAIGDEVLTVFIPGTLIAFDRSIGAVYKTIERHLDDPVGGAVSCDSHRFRLENVDRRSVIGNGFCEIGETIFLSTSVFSGVFAPNVDWSGIDDCSFVIATCPSPTDDPSLPCSGSGVCSFAGTGTCNCFVGYEGDACDMCRDGYALRNGRCLPMGAQPVDISNASDVTVPRGTINDDFEEESAPDTRENRKQLTLMLSTLIGIAVVIGLAAAFAVYLGCPMQNDQSPLTSIGGAISSASDDHSRYSLSGTESHDITASASNKTTSSGTPIAVKLEPEDVGATPPKRVSEIVDGSNFHGNSMHRPIIASSSTSTPSYPLQLVTHNTVDVSGERRQTRRMPSPEENLQLFPIEEGISVTFETDSPFARSNAQRQKASKSLESDTPALNSFDRWLGSSSLDASPRTAIRSSTEFGKERSLSLPEPKSESIGPSIDQSTTTRSEDNRTTLRRNESTSSFEFDQQQHDGYINDVIGSPSTPIDQSGIAPYVDRWGRDYFGQDERREQRSNSSDERSGQISTESPRQRKTSL